jgi:hypothetical protein
LLQLLSDGVTRLRGASERKQHHDYTLQFSTGKIALTVGMRFTCRMHTYPRSPKEMTSGMMYFPRMLDKIRLLGRGELHEDYHENLGAPRTLDGACCNFLRINYDDLRERILQSGTDEEILEWCFQNGRQPNEGDLFVWNAFMSKLGWRDSFTSVLEKRKKKYGIADRTDILTIADLIDFDEARKS